MTSELENTAVDTVETTETGAEQSTEVVDNAGTPSGETESTEAVSDKEAQKAQMRENQIKNLETNARQLEEVTGMKLEDLLATVNNTNQPVEQPTTPQSDDIDFDKFSELAELAVKQKFGDKFARLDTIDQAFAKLEAKEAVNSLPSDYKEYESEMVSFLKANKDIAKLKNGAEIAYNYARGKNADKIAKSAAQNAETNIKETEEVQKVAFVENAKHSASEEKAASLKDLANLSVAEYAALPKEVREKILREASK